MSTITAPIIQILRTSLHDGPGVRTVVYFKGCNLSCTWCHNPESQRFDRELVFHRDKCIGCGRCLSVCPVSAHAPVDAPAAESAAAVSHIFRRDRCTACGTCADACPAEALSLCGEEKTPAEVFSEIRRDAMYYRMSGGGVTFSGGECLLYPDFLCETLHICRDAGIHTAVETAFHVPYETVSRLSDAIDLFIIDIKHMDTDKHRLYTGVGNERILENLSRLSATGKPILIRTPLIPGVNDDDENLTATAHFIASLSRDDIRWELLKYNNLGTPKYESIGRTATVFADKAQDNTIMDAICDRINRVVGRELAFYHK